MVEREKPDIAKFDRDLFVIGPVTAVCKGRGFDTWCRLPYPDHPNGCPNYGVKKTCPPFAKHFPEVYELRSVHLSLMRFDFGEYLKQKRIFHPDWTERALRNPRHFQEHLDSRLHAFTNSLVETPEFAGNAAIYNPEAMGVNVHLTLEHAGITLEWPPKIDMFRVALIDVKISGRK